MNLLLNKLTSLWNWLKGLFVETPVKKKRTKKSK